MACESPIVPIGGYVVPIGGDANLSLVAQFCGMRSVLMTLAHRSSWRDVTVSLVAQLRGVQLLSQWAFCIFNVVGFAHGGGTHRLPRATTTERRSGKRMGP